MSNLTKNCFSTRQLKNEIFLAKKIKLFYENVQLDKKFNFFNEMIQLDKKIKFQAKNAST